MSQLNLFGEAEQVYTYAERNVMNYILACNREYDREMKLLFPVQKKTGKAKPNAAMMEAWRGQMKNFTYA